MHSQYKGNAFHIAFDGREEGNDILWKLLLYLSMVLVLVVEHFQGVQC